MIDPHWSPDGSTIAYRRRGFSSGYAANVGLLSALAGPDDVIVSDALNHASITSTCVYAQVDREKLRAAVGS